MMDWQITLALAAPIVSVAASLAVYKAQIAALTERIKSLETHSVTKEFLALSLQQLNAQMTLALDQLREIRAEMRRPHHEDQR